MVIEPIIWRRSIREYSDEPVLDESVIDLIKAAQFAPTAQGTRAVEFIVVKKASVKKELFEALGQDFIKKAPVLLVSTVDTKKSILPESDLAIAGAFIMIQAAALGLGTVWKHIAPESRATARKILGIPNNYELINIIPVGYPFDDLPDHGDSEFEPKKIHSEKF